MPGLLVNDHSDGLTAAVQQIILSSSESDYLDQLIPLLKNAETQTQVLPLIQALNHVSNDRELEIERICNDNHQEFIASVNQLQSVREGTVSLTSHIMNLAESIEASTETLAEQKKALVDSRGIRQNIDDTTEALNDCLEVLQLANQVHDLLREKNHYAALRALEELRNVHLREVTRYKIAEYIEKSVPATQRLIAEAVMSDLNTWLYRIRESSQFLGEVAFYHTEMRRTRMKEKLGHDDVLSSFKLNSAVELVVDESEEFDALNNEELTIDFSPLFECLHIHNALGETDKFRAEYAATRRRQKDLLIPQQLRLLDEEANDLQGLLEGIAGFAIIEKATMQKTENLRAQADIDELWDGMCHAAISLISSSLHTVNNPEDLLKIKGVIALFIQTMDSWGYSVSNVDSLLLTLFDKYSSLLKKRFSDDFQEVSRLISYAHVAHPIARETLLIIEQIFSSDDYMPMPVDDIEAYTRVIAVSWYTPPPDQQDPEKITYPCVLPFSQMYPLVCIDIQNFIKQTYLFNDDHFSHSAIIDKTLKESLDELLVDKVAKSLVERLSSQFPGQIVQILTNLDHFEQACGDLEALLISVRSSTSAAGPITLRATAEFAAAKKKTERRIFELVNSKIDDLVETAEYPWTTDITPLEVSSYMQELMRYLSNIMSSVLLGLPEQIKELIYVEALAHISTALVNLPLDPSVKHISWQAATSYLMDVGHLMDFVEVVLQDSKTVLDGMAELRQTTDLIGLAVEGKGEEFFDVSKSAQRFGKVDKLKGAELLEKIRPRGAEPPRNPPTGLTINTGDDVTHNVRRTANTMLGGFQDRFGGFSRRDRTG